MFAERLAAYAAERCGLAPGPDSPGGARLVVGTSGGVDSTVLFRSLRALGYDAVAVYVHHGLRTAADDEAAFVVAMARAAGAEGVVVRATVRTGNRQAEARLARYAALGDVAREHGCAVIATAHTATDQAETVLMALVRGAGLRGLAGMDPCRPLVAAQPEGLALVRPLLWATRADVEAEALAQGWSWCEDDSNASDAYRRNRIRHHVLPLLEAEGGPATATRIAAAADAARAALRPAVSVGPDASVPLDALRALPPSVRAAALFEAHRTLAPDLPRSRATVARLAGLVDAPVGRRVGFEGVTVWRDRERLRWVRDGPAFEPVAVRPGPTVFGEWQLITTPLGAVPAAFESARWTETVDADALGEGLMVRPWHAGDRIATLGGRRRLVSDVLRDAGVEPSERAGWGVLVSGERVLWVVGVRLSSEVAVTAATRRAVRLEWAPAVSPAVGSESPAG